MTQPGKSGSFDPKKAQSYVERIEAINAEIASETGTFMAAMKEKKNDIADILEEAKSNGIGKTPLKTVIKARALTLKLEAMEEALEDEQRETYDQILHAIGDLAELPLGKAALDRAEKGGAAVDALTLN
jgi:uncharacterized protein (UPF0335 family)